MTVTLVGYPVSPIVRKVRVSFEQKGITYANDPIVPYTEREKVLPLNSAGTVPVLLQEGSAPITESADIVAWSQQVERGVVHDERRRCHGNRRAGVSSSPRARSTVRYASRTASAWRIVGPTSAENSSR